MNGYPSLDRSDLEQLIRSLDEGLMVLERRGGRLSASEIHVKSMLSTLRNEVFARYAATYGSTLSEESSGRE